MNEEFTPIDHKDSDPEYRAQVLAAVESVLGSELEFLNSSDVFIGEWQRSYPQLPNQKPQRLTYLSEGTFRSPFDTEGAPLNRWQLANGRYTETTWCEPMPEYGMEEGTWNPVTYHCAQTEQGAIAIWNGDGSLLSLLTQCAE